jgi:2,3,4,5-tetrahydropyridine-2-carboxylate N-succinyltransferase
MLEHDIKDLVAAGASADRDKARAVFAQLREALSSGQVRAAEPDASSPLGWRVNLWVKQGILLGFRFGDMIDASMDHGKLPFYDKDTLPLKKPGLGAGVRIVPGGSAIRDGAYLAPGVICMPPMYVNIGAYVGEGSMIDSHALVGSCAQVGARVHVSAAAQIGGVIEPVGALPVIIEDDVLVGGNTGIYEGAIVRARAVIAAGTVLTGSRRSTISSKARSSSRPRIVRSSSPEGAVVAGAGGDVRQGRRMGPLARDAGHRQIRDSRAPTRARTARIR